MTGKLENFHRRDLNLPYHKLAPHFNFGCIQNIVLTDIVFVKPFT
jgi:hypothetical protein